jgi:GrpB-like predicted nucleotidyltransferase (UPF0157 family)
MLEPARPGRYACVVCGNVTLVDPNGAGEVCPVCWWEHVEGSASELADPDREGGPNFVSLAAARASYARHGIADPTELYYGGAAPRPPHPWELPGADEPVPSWAAVEMVRVIAAEARRELALAAILGRDGLPPGLRRGTVRLVGAGPWAEAFALLATPLRRALPPAVGVEHVGSTAVPGLLARPIVDVAVGLDAGTSVDEVTRVLVGLGYEHRGDLGDEGGVLLVLGDGPEHRRVHLHVVGLADEQWACYLALRDRLRRDAAARAAYAALKRELVARHADDPAAYTAGKAELIARLLAEERGRRGDRRATGADPGGSRRRPGERDRAG